MPSVTESPWPTNRVRLPTAIMSYRNWPLNPKPWVVQDTRSVMITILLVNWRRSPIQETLRLTMDMTLAAASMRSPVQALCIKALPSTRRPLHIGHGEREKQWPMVRIGPALLLTTRYYGRPPFRLVAEPWIRSMSITTMDGWNLCKTGAITISIVLTSTTTLTVLRWQQPEETRAEIQGPYLITNSLAITPGEIPPYALQKPGPLMYSLMRELIRMADAMIGNMNPMGASRPSTRAPIPMMQQATTFWWRDNSGRSPTIFQPV